MSDMRLVRTRDVGLVELVATKIADNLIRAGQVLHSRWAVIPPAEIEPTFERLNAWRVSLSAFVTYAAPLDFSQRRVLAAGICTRTAFDTYMGLLRQMGVIISYPRSGTIWAAGWDKRAFLVKLRRRWVEAPFSLDADPPPLLKGRVAESQFAQRTQLAQLSTVSTWARDTGENQAKL